MPNRPLNLIDIEVVTEAHDNDLVDLLVSMLRQPLLHAKFSSSVLSYLKRRRNAT
jgi:hypothetical protein